MEQRNIRFRAWDKHAQRMLRLDAPSIISIHQWPTEASNYSYYDGKIEHHHADIELMQSTGITDKRGVEIFEHDIIKLYSSDKLGVAVYWDEHIAGFGFKNQSMAEHLNFRKLSSLDYEVIGNLHQHPELLQAA